MPPYDSWTIAAETLAIDGVPPFAQRVRDLGRIDNELRETELRIVPDLIFSNDGKYQPAPGTVNRFAALDHAFALSNLWVGELFEVVRIVASPKFHKNLDVLTKRKLKDLKRDLAMVRNPLIKMQISGKGRYVHYPESIISDDGSTAWRVRDHELNEHVFSRRKFADRLLALFSVRG